MSEISTVAIITAKSGGAELVEQALRALAEATHGEAGCIRYTLNRGLQDRNVFVTIEKWRSQDDLDAHLKSAHIAAMFAAAGEHLAGAPVIVSAEALPVGDPAKSVF